MIKITLRPFDTDSKILPTDYQATTEWYTMPQRGDLIYWYAFKQVKAKAKVHSITHDWLADKIVVHITEVELI